MGESHVALLLWPNDSRADLQAVVKRFAATQHRQYRLYYRCMLGQTDEAEMQKVNTAAVQQQPQLDQMLSATQTDSYEVWELRRRWKRYQALELATYFPNLEVFHTEIDQRFIQIERLRIFPCVSAPRHR